MEQIFAPFSQILSKDAYFGDQILEIVCRIVNLQSCITFSLLPLLVFKKIIIIKYTKF